MKTEEKKELIEAARIAGVNEAESEFWAEVAAHLDATEGDAKPKVERRNVDARS